MADKLERFSQRARQVLQLAQSEADRLSHHYIGTEHLLLGMVREENGIAGRVLRGLGAEPDRVAEMVERMTGVGRGAKAQRLDLTPRTKQVIEFAIDEARTLGHNYIGTEHLLLGVVRQTDGVAIDVLRRLDLSADHVRFAILRAIIKVTDDSQAEVVAHEDQLKDGVRSLANLITEKDWNIAEVLLQKQEVVMATIAGYNQGGVIINIRRLRGFVPESQLSPAHQHIVGDKDLPSEQRFQKLVGQQVLIKVIEIDRALNRLILSERATSKDRS